MNPWVALGLVLVWISSLSGVGYWQNTEGHVAERVACLKRDNDTLRKANIKIVELEQAARDDEQRHAIEVNQIAGVYEKEMRNVKADKDAVLAKLRAGTVVLRDPYATGQRSAGGEAGQVAAGASQCDGGAPGGLSVQTGEFLVGLASEADDIVKQLAACQAVVIDDRK